MRELAAQFLALAEKQGATVPLMVGHRVMGISLLTTGDVVAGRAHFDHAMALYDPAVHRPLATRFGQDLRFQLWSFGRSLVDAWLSRRCARGRQPGAQGCARDRSSRHFDVCAGVRQARLTSCAEITRQQARSSRNLSLWRTKRVRSVLEGERNICSKVGYFAVTGKASDAVHTITTGISALRSTGATVVDAVVLSYLARAYAELGQFDEAWRCIGEAMTIASNNQGKVVRGRGPSRRRRNRAEVAGAGCGESRSLFRARARGRTPAASKVLGTPRRNEHGAALARSGQAG